MNLFQTKPLIFLVSLVIFLFGLMACTQNNQEDVSQEESVNEQTSEQDITIIAHRGDSWYAPENTLASVNSAWQKNADAVEVDVYLTADNRVVALHDQTTERTGDKILDVKESTAEDLRQVDVGSWKSEEFAGEQIPFLENIVETIPPGDKKVVIEIKGTGETIPQIKKIVEESGKEDQIVIIAFNFETITESKETMPNIPAYWLISAPRDDEGNPQPIDTENIATAKEHNLDGLNVNYQSISQELVDQCREQNMEIYVWTVNEISDLEKMAALGVDGITTDRIDNAHEVL